MSTLEYVGLPACATRLQGKAGVSPAKPIHTPLPKVSESPSTQTMPSSPTSSTTSLTAGSFTSPTNAAFSMLPQLLFSSAIPNASTEAPRTRRGSMSMEQRPLLSARDPLSLPITSNNFKRFVARAGPIFWLQDRVEEIVTWKKGSCVTAAWLAGYAFLCYFPKMVFFLPHAALLAVILATYQYPAVADGKNGTATSPTAKSSNTSETTGGDFRSNLVDWQANLQGIQNLMGAVSDGYDLLQPLTHHFILQPAHLTRSPPPQGATPSPPPRSPYPPYILLMLLLTSPPLLLILSSPLFPARLVTFIAGALPVLALHPAVGPILLHLLDVGKRVYDVFAGNREVVEGDTEVMVLMQVVQDAGKMVALAKHRVILSLLACRRFLAKFGLRFASTYLSSFSEEEDTNRLKPVPIQSLIERFVDDDRLDDRVWRSEMREVEIWENERFQPQESILSPRDEFRKRRSSSILSPKLSYYPNGDLDTETDTIPLSAKLLTQGSMSSEDLGELGPGTWSKSYLRPTERKPWTRARDGWGGIRPRLPSIDGKDGKKEGKGGEKRRESSSDDRDKDGSSGGGVANEGGYVSSNLTFSLSPGWSFVQTEGWRKDRLAEWAGEAGYTDLADTSGWVYTNDTWGGTPRKHPIAVSVTKRRRWTRRIWYSGEDRNTRSDL